jgi:hypothetical protein
MVGHGDRYSAGVGDLILSAHHSICDGMSLAFAMRDVLQALSGSKLNKLSLHSSQEHMLGMCSEPRAQRRSGQRPEVTAAPTVYRSNSSISRKPALSNSHTF